MGLIINGKYLEGELIEEYKVHRSFVNIVLGFQRKDLADGMDVPKNINKYVKLFYEYVLEKLLVEFPIKGIEIREALNWMLILKNADFLEAKRANSNIIILDSVI